MIFTVYVFKNIEKDDSIFLNQDRHKFFFSVATRRERGEVVEYLQSISEELVHLGDLGCNTEVDGAVANLNDESTTDLGVDLSKLSENLDIRVRGVQTYLGDNLELLALADV
jgi:hypothetical protein